jgi:serine/threonine-protein kinase
VRAGSVQPLPPIPFENLPTEPEAQGCDSDADLDSEANAMLRAIAYSPPRQSAQEVPPGTKWGDSGRYTIERCLGRGGMGSVYAATDTVLERVVALKVLDAAAIDQDAAYRARLHREARLAARVEHERIARVYDVGSHDGHAFVAMEYIQGGTLRQWMAGRRVSIPQIVDVAIQIAEGLGELHRNGVVHRDLKPENVMLTAQGGVKLLDFGLARHAMAPAGDTGASGRSAVLDGASIASASGTPGYMAPEQCAGKPIDERVDVFAFGVILYELVTSERLFRGKTIGAVVQATLAWVPDLRGEAWTLVPGQLREQIARMLAPDPEDRFKNGADVLAALRELSIVSQRTAAPLPAATAQAIGKAATQQALPGRRPALDRRGLVRNALVLSAAIVAWVVLGDPIHVPPSALAPVPLGMVRIDGGTIRVGRDVAEIDRECAQVGASCDRLQMLREVPHVQVTVAPFFLDRDEITNEEFAAMLDVFRGTLSVTDDDTGHYPRYVHRDGVPGPEGLVADLSALRGGIQYSKQAGYRPRPGHERLPVAQVTWFGASLFCSSKGKRLPTEDEWEAAARGRADRRFPWGDELPRCGEVAIPNDGELLPPSSPCPEAAELRAVGTAPQDVTPDGVHDLGGNLTEWTSSLYVSGNRGAHPQAAAADAARVIRGGSFGESWMARTSARNRLGPSVVAANVGFRCALNAEDAPL